MRLRFVSAGAAQGLVRTLAAREGIEVEGHFGAVGAMLDRLRGGEPCDVVILTRSQQDALAAEGVVEPASVADLGAVATAIAVRDADAPPDVGDGARLREALRAADAIYFPDPQKATAGTHFAKVLAALGLAEEVAARLRPFPNGASAMAAMAQARGRPIGCTQSTEIIATPGVRLAAPLPPGHDLRTVYSAAVRKGAEGEAAAARFVALLAGAASARQRREAGFE